MQWAAILLKFTPARLTNAADSASAATDGESHGTQTYRIIECL